MGGPNVGDPAPAFSLPGTGEQTYTLADFRGRKVVLAFYPADNSMMCTQQLCSYRDAFADFERLDAVVLGVSGQSEASHAKFSARHEFPFPLLADAGNAVAKAYGIMGPLGPKRSVFIIDGEGVVRWKHVAALVGVTYQSPTKLAEVLAAL